MTCTGFFTVHLVRSPIPGESKTTKTTTSWSPCQLRRAHPGPCGPRLDKDETFDDRQARADLLEEIRHS